MNKRLVAITMAAAMTVGMTATVYAKEDAAFTIGARFPVTIDQMQQQTMDNITELVEAAGGELLVENAALTPEGNIQAYS